MLDLFYIVPLLLIFVSTFYFNKQRGIVDKRDLTKTTIIHGLVSYAIITLTLLSGFINTLEFFCVLIALILLFIPMFLFERNHIDEIKDQLRTLANNFIFFLRTVYLLYVFLSIFRYLAPYYQIPLAIIITTILFAISSYLKNKYIPTSRNMLDYLLTWRKGNKIVIPVIFVILIFMIFNFPVYNLEVSMNLSNSNGYLEFEDYPTNIQNDYTQEQLIQLETEIGIGDEIIGYWYDDYYLTLLVNTLDLQLISYTYDLSTKELITTIDVLSSQHDLEQQIITYTENVTVVGSSYNNEFTSGEYTVIGGILGTHYYKMKILDSNGEIYSYFNHIPLKKITNLVKYPYSKIELYNDNNGTIQFIQRDGYYDSTIVTVYQLNQKEADLKLPFYSHYSLISLVWILSGFLIPYINKENPIETISFDNAVKGKFTHKKE